MKRKKLLLPLIFLCLSSCNTNETTSFDSGNLLDSLMIISDIHFLSDSLTSKLDKYLPEKINSDGRIQEKDDELLDIIIDTANKNNPKAVIITGDLTYNGEKQSHLDLANKLNEINDNIDVLVIPGNHDILSTNSTDFSNDELVFAPNINSDEFKQIYINQGYNGAYSYDEHSLSYIYEVNPNQWILMFDSAMYYNNDLNDANTVGGYILPETITWLETHLKYAQDHNINVISAMHHNLYIHNPLFYRGYQLYNYEEVQSLFSKYNVKINFSGHLHIQSIKHDEINDNTIYDIATNSTGIYGHQYGLLDIHENTYVYNSYSLLNEEQLSYSKNRFMECYKKKINSVVKQYSNEDQKIISELLCERNAEYFRGNLYSLPKLTHKEKQLIEEFKTKINNYNNSYYRSFLEADTSINHHHLITYK